VVRNDGVEGDIIDTDNSFFFYQIVSAVAWGLIYGLGFIGILRAVLFMICVDFLIVGALVATGCW
jgi:hypothetical protein